MIEYDSKKCARCQSGVNPWFSYVIVPGDDHLEKLIFCSTPCFREHVVEWGKRLAGNECPTRRMFKEHNHDANIPF